MERNLMCRRCGGPLPEGSAKQRRFCDPCKVAKQAENLRNWRDRNPENKKEQQARASARKARQYREDEEVRARRLEANRRWRSDNKEKVRENVRRWVALNPERARMHWRNWERRNPEYVRRKNAKRKAMRAKTGGSYSQRDWDRLVQRYGGMCAYCKTNRWTDAEHVIPLARGGSSFIGNMLPACSQCNSSKADKTIMEWRLWSVRRRQGVGTVMAS